MDEKNAKIEFETDIVELLKKYGIESKQPIESIRIVTEISSIPRVEINNMIVEVKNGR